MDAGNTQAIDSEVCLSVIGRLLLDAIPADKRRLNAGKVMVYLAQQTILRSAGHTPPRFSTKEIHCDLQGNPNQEPSQWLSPLWTDITERYFREIEPSLIEHCRKAGLSMYPVFEKISGKPTLYGVAIRPIPNEEYCDPVVATEPRPVHSRSVIEYNKDLTLKLSRAGMFFQSGLKWTPAKRYSYILWQLVFFAMVFGYVFLIWLVLFHRKEPITGQDLTLLTMGVVIPWAATRYFSQIFRIFEDRIMIAPDWMLAWKETGATVEISRAADLDLPSTIYVHRYSATCPICGWMVKPDRGEPEYPGRIIGRCEENPREHVFSFDRSTRKGRRLRA